MLKRLFLSSILVTLAASAQVAPRMSGSLYRKPAKTERPAATPRPPSLGLSLPPPVTAALNPLTAEDMRRLQGREGFEAIGAHRRLPEAIARLQQDGTANRTSVSGAWEQTDSGMLWRLHVISREAFAMRVHFHDFRVGEGRVWVHTSAGQIAGPYTGTGLFAKGDFWSDILFGQSLTIEYEPAPGDPAGLAVPFELREITHIWRDPRTVAGGAPAPPWPSTLRATENAKPLRQQRVGAVGELVEQEAPCHVDVTCAPEWAETARGVGLILFEESGGTAVCSGSMLNTRTSSFEPYFLTAAHCLKTEAVARTVLSFWRFQSQTCNGPFPDMSQVPRTTGGARLLATLGDFGDSKGDMTFLEILGELPDGIFFQGWEPARQPFGTRVTGIHHPRGTAKRISSGTIVPDTFFDTDSAIYALVAETSGHTENGSSGSALFSRPGVVVGALSFGLKTDDICALNPSPSGYTHFSVIYPEIEDFLEDRGGTPPADDPPTALEPGRPERFSLGPVDSATLFTGSNSFVLEVPSDAVRVTLTLTSDNANLDADLHARFDLDVDVDEAGEIVADFSSTGDAGNEQIVIDADSNPPLRSGSLFVSIALFDTDVVSSGTLRADVELAPPPPPPSGGILTSGQPATFDFAPVDGPTLFTGDGAYQIDVPAGAAQLDIRISTLTSDVDVDLHVSRGAPPSVQNGSIVSDFESTSLSGDELVTVTPDNGLAPGTYFAALAVWTENARAQGEILADVLGGGGPDPSGVDLLSSGETSRFNLPAVDAPSFFTDLIYAVDVPANVGRLVVELATETPNADLDLFVRLGQPPEIQDGEVVANYSAEGLTGNEQIVIDAGSQPPLQPGRYYFGVVLYTADLAAAGSVKATVEVGAPTIRLSAVTNAGSFEAGVVAPGQIVSLFGSAMGPGQGVQPGLDASGRVPTFAAGTIVLFGGVPAPLFFLRADQINAQVPYDVAGRGLIDVVVVTQGVATNVLQVEVRDAAPGFFQFPDGSNRAIAVNSDGSINSASNPARRGDFVILYATGEGQTNVGIEEGVPAPSNPLALPLLPVRVRFGGVEQTPFFAGLAPGFAGLLQINIFVPANSPTGAAVPLELLVGVFAASARPTIAVQ